MRGLIFESKSRIIEGMKIKIPRKVIVGFSVFLASAGIFYGVFRMTTGTRATGSAGDTLVPVTHSDTVAYGDGWTTQKYQIDNVQTESRFTETYRGMCLESGKYGPLTEAGPVYGYLDFRDNAEMIKIMLVTDRSYYPSLYDAFNSSYNWSSLASAVGMSYSGTEAEIFALGHILVSAAYKGDYSHTNGSNTLIDAARENVVDFFEGSYSSGYGDWTIGVFIPVNTTYQEVGWLIGSSSGGDDPTPPTPTEYAYFGVHKTDAVTGANLQKAKININGTVYETGADGKTACVEVVAGYSPLSSVSWYEVEAPENYKTDSTVHSYMATTASTTCVYAELTNEPIVTGGVKIRKVDADTGGATNGGNSVAGSVFGVYRSGTDAKVAEFTVAIDSATGVAIGQTADNALGEGEYYVKEIAASDGYIASTATLAFAINSSQQGLQDFSTEANSARWFQNQVKKGGLEITKYKSVGGTESPLSGVTFIVKRQGSSEEATRITTNASGYAATASNALVHGTYELYEVANSTNEAFQVNEGTPVRTVTVGETNGTIVTASAVTNNLKDNPTLSTEARNSKKNARSDEGATELEIASNASVTDKVIFSPSLTNGLLYKLEGELWVLDRTYPNAIKTVTETWVQGSEAYKDVVFSGVDTSGLIGKTLSIIQTLYVCNGHSGTTCTGEWIKLVEHNGDLEHPDTNESVTVKSLGIGTSASSGRGTGSEKLLTVGRATIHDTITLDGLVNGNKYYIKGQVVDESGTPITLLNPRDKDGGTSGDATVRVEEYTMAGATGAQQTAFMDLMIDTSAYLGKAVTVYETLYDEDMNELVAHRVLGHSDQTLTVEQPTISTTAANGELTSSKTLYISRNATIQDTVEMTKLMPGTTYTLETTVYKVERDGEGHRIRGEKVGGPFTEDHGFTTGSGESYTKTVTVTLDTREYTNAELVVYEVLYYGTQVIQRHEDPTDESQIVTVQGMGIGTSANSGRGGEADKRLLAGSDVTIHDEITLNGLTNGTKYYIRGELVDSRGDTIPLTNGDGGNAYRKTVEYTMDKTTGTEVTKSMELKFNSVSYKGQAVTVYETLLDEDMNELVSHKVLGEESQTLTVEMPAIGTTAKDGVEGETDNVIEPEAEQKIVDTVAYRGLVSGQTYVLTGWLMRKTSETAGEELAGAERIIQSFVAEAPAVGETDSYTTMTFEIDASELAGAEIVVFESLSQVVGGEIVTIAEHKNIQDGNQTIKVRPKIGTKAVDKYDGNQEVGVGRATIVDTVEYHGLRTGINYTMSGYLVLVDGTTVREIPDATASKSFRIGEEGTEEADGEVTLEFSIDTKEYAGKKIVVFEELTYTPESGGIDDALITEHKDPNDEAQTVKVAVPTLKTTAKDKIDGDKEMETNSVVIVVDEVAYTGLVPGTEYVVRGELRDKESGEVFTTNDGKAVEAVYKKFTPDRDSGSVEMEFEFNSTGLSGKEAVVFEELYLMELSEEEQEPVFKDDDLIAEHKDLDDYAQTVWVKIVKPNTGVVTRGLEGARARGVYAALGGIVVVSVGAVVAIRTRKKQKFGF